MANNWKLKRNDTGEELEFDQDMHWTDEFSWSAISQTQPVYSLAGAVLVQQGIKQAGRPITLDGDWVWYGRTLVETLRGWTDVPGLKMTLTHYDGRQFTVGFRYHDTALNKVEPVRYATPEVGTDRYTLAIQLMTM